MKHLKNFNENSHTDLEVDCMYSRGGIYLYQYKEFATFERFVNNHSDIFRGVKWAINPLVNTYESSAEMYFNMYIEKYPIFTIIIDTNKISKNNLLTHNDNRLMARVIGVSFNNDGEIGVSVDETDRRINIDIFDEYLKKLNITREYLS